MMKVMTGCLILVVLVIFIALAFFTNHKDFSFNHSDWAIILGGSLQALGTVGAILYTSQRTRDQNEKLHQMDIITKEKEFTLQETQAFLSNINLLIDLMGDMEFFCYMYTNYNNYKEKESDFGCPFSNIKKYKEMQLRKISNKFYQYFDDFIVESKTLNSEREKLIEKKDNYYGKIHMLLRNFHLLDTSSYTECSTFIDRYIRFGKENIRLLKGTKKFIKNIYR